MINGMNFIGLAISGILIVSISATASSNHGTTELFSKGGQCFNVPGEPWSRKAVPSKTGTAMPLRKNGNVVFGSPRTRLNPKSIKFNGDQSYGAGQTTLEIPPNTKSVTIQVWGGGGGQGGSCFTQYSGGDGGGGGYDTLTYTPPDSGETLNIDDWYGGNGACDNGGGVGGDGGQAEVTGVSSLGGTFDVFAFGGGGGDETGACTCEDLDCFNCANTCSCGGGGGDGGAEVSWFGQTPTGLIDLGTSSKETPSAVASPDGGTTVAVRGLDNQAYYAKVSIEGHVSQQWTRVAGGRGFNILGKPAVVYDATGKMRLYGVGPGKVLVENTGATVWRNVVGNIKVASGPTAVLVNKQVLLFFRGANNMLYTLVDEKGANNKPQALNISTNNAPGAAVDPWFNVILAVSDMNGLVETATLNPGGSIETWNWTKTSQKTNSAPAVNVDVNNNHLVFAQGAGNAIYESANGGAWSVYSLDQTAYGPQVVTYFASPALVYTGTNNKVYENFGN